MKKRLLVNIGIVLLIGCLIGCNKSNNEKNRKQTEEISTEAISQSQSVSQNTTQSSTKATEENTTEEVTIEKATQEVTTEKVTQENTTALTTEKATEKPTETVKPTQKVTQAQTEVATQSQTEKQTQESTTTKQELTQEDAELKNILTEYYWYLSRPQAGDYLIYKFNEDGTYSENVVGYNYYAENARVPGDFWYEIKDGDIQLFYSSVIQDHLHFDESSKYVYDKQRNVLYTSPIYGPYVHIETIYASKEKITTFEEIIDMISKHKGK